MKRLVFSIVCLAMAAACDKTGGDERMDGELRVSFAAQGGIRTMKAQEIPDTGLFNLSIRDASGRIIYEGLYRDCPESLTVPAGNYTVSAVSSDFGKPAFSSPQYGDSQIVAVPSGGVCSVHLLCVQMNSAIRLDVDSGFLEEYPEGVLFLRSAQGKLMYAYSESRLAYFSPGAVSLVLYEEGVETILMTRVLLAQEVLVLKVCVSGTSVKDEDAGISMSVDTSRFWYAEDFVMGGEGADGSEADEAYTVAQAMSSAGQEDVWVCGYIVGGNLTSSSASFEEPFTTKTNLLLGPRAVVSSRSSCIAVHLPSGSVRDALNLVDNPHLLGTKVYLKGDISASYFGLTGLKNTSDYKF